MNRQKIERAVIGFVMGGVMGVVISIIFMWLFNQVLRWIGRELIEITWGSVIPLALIVGLSMAINMANPPFGD